MKKRRALKIILLLALVLAALIYDSNSRVVVTEHTVAADALPEVFDGFTVVQLSDIHGARLWDSGKLAEKVAAAQPDIIAITGDMVDEETDMEAIDSLLARLAEIAPVYYVTGNHEWGAHRVEELVEVLDRRGVTYLSNSYEKLEREGESIVLAGVEDPNGPYDMIKPDELVDIIENEQGEAFTLLLGHRNYWVEKYPELEVDIIMCGHAHGGIVRLPVLGGVLGTGFELFPEHIEGLVESGRYTLVISRGLGNSIPVPRFLNNPEIVVLTLKSE